MPPRAVPVVPRRVAERFAETPRVVAANEPLRICFVCNEYPPGMYGGIGTLTQLLARNLARAGHHVRVVGIYGLAEVRMSVDQDEQVEVWRFHRPPTRWSGIADRRRVFRTVAGWSREGEIDLVEVPDWQGWAAGWPHLPVPVITRLSGSVSYFAAEMGQRVNRTIYWIERASLRRADGWCAESRYIEERTRQVFRLPPGAGTIIYNPVDVPASPPWRHRSRHRVLFAGTLTAKKGIVSLARSWANVLKEIPQAELHVFGKDGRAEGGGSMREFLLAELGPGASTARFHGQVTLEELMEALAGARVAVLPSYAEGFALTPLHAMAAGCPTIYSPRGSGPELIEPEETGLLVDPDDIEGIARSIVRVLRDDALAERLGRAGRARVESSFSVPALLSRNEDFYRACLERFHRGLRGTDGSDLPNA